MRFALRTGEMPVQIGQQPQEGPHYKSCRDYSGLTVLSIIDFRINILVCIIVFPYKLAAALCVERHREEDKVNLL